jgi:uncharacterized protein
MKDERRRSNRGGRARMTALAGMVVLATASAGPVAPAATPFVDTPAEAEWSGPAERGSGPTPLREIELAVQTADGLTLPATLRVPLHSGPDRPGMVLVHGAGQGSRGAYRAEAEAFARAGIATLAYDRRTVGYSLTERSYGRLADDVVAAAELLRSQPGVDPAKVGLWGLSEGGWVAPLAASRAADTAFLVVVGANGFGPLRQQIWAEAVKMQAAGVRGSLVDAASSATYRLIAASGMFPESQYEPEPTLRRLTLPVLGLWGALDRSTPPVESVATFRAALEEGGNPHYTLRTVAGAQHALRTSTTGFDRGADHAPGYVDLVGSWVHEVVGGHPPPSSVAGTGSQLRQTADVPPLAWYESAQAHGVALGVMLGGFLGFGVLAVAFGRRRSSRTGSARSRPATSATGSTWMAATVAGTGTITVVGTLCYLGLLATTRGGQLIDPGPLVVGRTLPWLGLQATAAITVVGGLAMITRLVREVRRSRTDRQQRSRRTTGERLRLTLLLGSVALFLPWSLHWGLLLP